MLAAWSQVRLEADGAGQTYELINSVLAPDGDVIEAPDCSHPEVGRHITEQFDTELNKHVFSFTLHVDDDDDRCRNFDRQRNEIKTYDKSPDNLLGVLGEQVIYSWKFKLPEGFQVSSSFTHLHQLKAVDGPEDAMPLITLTARKGSPDDLELRYARSLSQETLVEFPLQDFRGRWVEVVEDVVYGDNLDGRYAIEIKAIDNGETLFQYADDAIRMWKTDAAFVRPKWGIYRSLNNSQDLKDESVLFADFSIEEVNVNPLSVMDTNKAALYPNPVEEVISIRNLNTAIFGDAQIYDLGGRLIQRFEVKPQIDVSLLGAGMYFIKLNGGDQGDHLIKFLKK